MTDANRFVGRYAIYGEIASGGMATVHFGHLFSTAGFSRPVAIKRLHPQLAKNPDFVAMFLDEAHVTARIRHPNVVSTLDVVSLQGEIFIVMDYVHGESLWRLVGIKHEGTGRPVPHRIAAAIASNVLHGLHAAHEATSESAEPLGIVHRDVSPQNVIVGKDGIARVLDFGIAKARDRSHVTRGGALKGKVSYMAPEQLAGRADRRTDVYACAVVLWEAVTGLKLFAADGDIATAERVRSEPVTPPSAVVSDVPPALDAVILKGLSKSPDDRYQDAASMALALEREVGVASPSEVGKWVDAIAHDVLETRTRTLTSIEKVAPLVAPDVPTQGHIDLDPDGLAPTRAIDVNPQGEATEVVLAQALAPSRRPPPMRTGRLLVATAGAAFVMGLAGAGVFTLVRRSPQTTATQLAPSVTASTAAPEPPTIATSVVDVPASAQPAVSALPAVSATATASASAAPRRPVVSNPCNPPYTVDARGIRHIKSGCLR